MKSLAGGLLIMTIACAAVPPEETPPNEDAREVGASHYRCNANVLAPLIGQQATEQLGAEALRRSGSRTLRWIRPGDVVTMDYRADRLNIRLDARNRVESFDCG